MSAKQWELPEQESALALGVPLGFLAMVPLWIAYEVTQQHEAPLRNVSELLLTYPLRPAGGGLVAIRRGLLLLLSVAALVHCLRRQWELGPKLLRVVGEGVLGALALGPLLVFLVGQLGEALPALPKLGEHSVGDSAYCLFALGSAAWEEVVFRLGLFPLLYLLFKELFEFGGVRGRGGRAVAEGLGALGSSLAFAGYHLSSFLGWLGVGGEPFRPAVFTYRLLAGLLLVALFRWRGLGVAAWSHGVFNLALCLGAGPAVFQ